MTGYFTKFICGGLGTVWIAKTNRGICRISFGGGEKQFLRSLPCGTKWIEDQKKFSRIIKKLKRCLRIGRADLKLDLAGTKFQKRVWKEIATIPRGETRSYAWLARAAGKPKAHRAAANACGKNPVPIIMPCHRVIASDGTIGGFSSGIRLKKKLLGIEENLKDMTRREIKNLIN